MSDFIEEIAIPIAIIFTLIGAFFCGASLVLTIVTQQACSNLGEVTKRKTDFRWFGGCFIEHNGEMIPYEKWELRNVTLKDGN